jgi:hypothetical protein
VSAIRKIAAILVADVVGYVGWRAPTKTARFPGAGRCEAT